MQDQTKTKAQLVQELNALRQRVEELEALEARRKQSEEMVQLTRLTIDRNPDTVLWIGPDARIHYANEGACQTLGYVLQELQTLTVHDIDANFPGDVWQEHWQELKARGSMVIESEHRSKDGRIVPVEVRINYLAFDDQEFNIAFARDITQRKQADATLSLLYAAIAAMPDGITISDPHQPDNPLIYVNPGFERLTGYTAGEVLGRNCRFLQGHEADQSELDKLRAAINAGEDCQVVLRNYRRDGTLFWNEFTLCPLRDEAGERTHFVGVQHDITERVRENEYRLEQERQAAAEAEEQARRMAMLNEMSKQLNLAHSEEEVLRTAAYYTPEIIESDRCSVALLTNTGDRFKIMALEGQDGAFPQGREFPLEGTDIERTIQQNHLIVQLDVADETLSDLRSRMNAPLVTGEGAIGSLNVASGPPNAFNPSDQNMLLQVSSLLASSIERQRLYASVEREKQYLEALMQSSPVAVAIVDLEARVVSWNPSAEKLFGYSRAEAIGCNINDLVAASKELRAEADQYSEGAVSGNFIHAITRRSRKDGTLVDVELLAVPVFVSGEKVAVYALYHDITELQRARREAEQARIAAEAANQAKSAFLANMSHELRTPLNAIIGFTRIVKRRGAKVLPAKQVENLDKVLISAEHLLGLINTILDIAKIEAGRMDVQPTTFHPAAFVDICLTTAQPLVKSRVRLTKEIADGLPFVYSDQDKLKQVVFNLLSNAAKFTHAGQITVSVRRLNEMLVLKVTDTGIGITEEALERIFEEFQQADDSTTRRYGGTGLGLSISRRLARLLGGDLTAASKEGVGSTFTLTIPLRYGETPTMPERYR